MFLRRLLVFTRLATSLPLSRAWRGVDDSDRLLCAGPALLSSEPTCRRPPMREVTRCDVAKSAAISAVCHLVLTNFFAARPFGPIFTREYAVSAGSDDHSRHHLPVEGLAGMAVGGLGILVIDWGKRCWWLGFSFRRVAHWRIISCITQRVLRARGLWFIYAGVMPSSR